MINIMVVYLMGHGFVVPNFPQIPVFPEKYDFKFYVPEGQLRADFIRERDGVWTQDLEIEYYHRQNLSLYDGPRSPYYIWNDGEAIAGIEDIPKDIEMREIRSGGVQHVEPPMPLHEHLLHSIEFKYFKEDLAGLVEYALFRELDDWEGHSFNIFRVWSAHLRTGQLSDKSRQFQFIVTPSWSASNHNKETAYKLSWLIRNLFNLRDTFRIPNDEPIHICWLACRTAMDGNDPESFLSNVHQSENNQFVNCIINNIYPL